MEIITDYPEEFANQGSVPDQAADVRTGLGGLAESAGFTFAIAVGMVAYTAASGLMGKRMEDAAAALRDAENATLAEQLAAIRELKAAEQAEAEENAGND